MPSCNTYHLTWVSLTLDMGASLHGCSSKAQLLLLTLDEGYLLTTAIPHLQCGIAPLGPSVPAQPPHLGVAPPGRWPSPWAWVAPPSCHPWPWARGGSSRSPPLASGARWLLLATPDLRLWVSPPGHHWPRRPGSSSQLPPLTSDAGQPLWPFLRRRSLAL